MLIPGLGADERLFIHQREAFPDLHVPPWLDVRPGEPLESFGRRMAGALAPPEAPYVLGGASFGGMVALEMSRHLRPDAIVLIGSALAGVEVRRWLRMCELASRPLPLALIDSGRRLTPLMARFLSSTAAEDVDLFLDMLRETPSSFLRNASRAIMRWRWEGRLACPVHRVHGERDHIIRPPPQQLARIIPDAGHVICLSHPDHVNRMLHDALREPGGPST